MVAFYRGHTFAASTKRTYSVHLRQYLQFCFHFSYQPVPASTTTLCRYAVYLANRLSPSSIRQYLNIVSLLHKENNHANPVTDNWALNMVIKGIIKVKGIAVQRKLPVDPNLLLLIKSHIDLTQPVNKVFWAICLTMFFGLLRKSNVLPPSHRGFISSKHLSRSDLRIHPMGLQHGLVVVIRWSKTIQANQRTLCIPLPYLHNHPLCPTTAIVRALALTPLAPLSGPAFLIPNIDGSSQSMLYSNFLRQLRAVLPLCKLNPSNFAGHSFRRGGATWALLQGMSTEVIKLLGDWHSSAYTAYLELPFHARTSAMYQFSKCLPSTFT